jgi:hypothetical protein
MIGPMRFLSDWGKVILVASVALVTLSLSIRRTRTAVLAALTGGLMSWGMFVQSGLGLMYLTMTIGMVIWLVLLVRLHVGRSTVERSQDARRCAGHLRHLSVLRVPGRDHAKYAATHAGCAVA